MKGVKRYVDMF